MKTTFRYFYLSIFFLPLLLPLFPKDQICLLPPPGYLQLTGEQETLLTNLSLQAAGIINTQYGKYVEAAYKTNESIAQYTVDMISSFAGEHSSLVLMVKKKGDATQPVPSNITGKITMAAAKDVAGGIFLQWAHFYNFFKDRALEPPVFIDEITTGKIKKSVLSNRMEIPDLYPQGLTSTKEGHLIICLTLADVEMDRHFKILGQPGKSLSDAGNYSYAYSVGITPGNTVYFKPSAGREVFRLIEGMPRPQKWRANTDLTGPFTVLYDGSIVLANYSERKAFKINGKKITGLPIFTSPSSMITAITTGPEGNLWVYDSGEKKIKIFTGRGELIDEIIPIMSPMDYIHPMSFQVYRDGSFILSGSGELIRFNRDGTPGWRFKKIQREFEEGLPTVFYFTLDKERGLIYLSDVMGKRIIKMMDTAYTNSAGIKNPVEEKIIALNKEYWRDGDIELLAQKAGIYEQQGAFEMAQELWEDILDEEPFHDQANEQLEAIEINILKQNALVMRNKTLEVLNRIGPASAEPIYKQALKLYERILNMDPGNANIQADLKGLKARYNEKDKVAGKNKMPIKIVKAKLNNIYPSLIHYYRKNPLGQVTVKNTLKSNITNVRVNILIRRYMDFPTESESIGLIKPGETKVINLYAELNLEVFNIEEDLPKQTEITVKYMVGSNEQSVTKNTGLTIYRRTSLSWDDSGKLASFIMPNDELVSGFSHKVLDKGDAAKRFKISKKFFRAIRICDALGLYGINYIEDPESPFSQVLGKEEAVDTVRFPRTTLMIHSGDCDDSTALLASLLEAAGIRTAIMTTPGHVFLAFDTGEPKENLWQFKTSRFEALDKEGTVWIPVETTVLNKGFREAWTQASNDIKKHSDNLEFLSVSSQRAKYPPLPLPGSQFSVVEPDSEIIDPVYTASVNDVVDNIYKKTRSDLENKLKDTTEKKKARLLVQLGILHARFGRYEAADTTLNDCIKEFPDFTPGYLNAANLRMENDQFKEAITILKKGLKKKPGVSLLNLLMARCYFNLGDKKQVAAYFGKVKKKSPSLADRYAYLEGMATGRARSADERPPAIWVIEE